MPISGNFHVYYISCCVYPFWRHTIWSLIWLKDHAFPLCLILHDHIHYPVDSFIVCSWIVKFFVMNSIPVRVSHDWLSMPRIWNGITLVFGYCLTIDCFSQRLMSIIKCWHKLLLPLDYFQKLKTFPVIFVDKMHHNDSVIKSEDRNGFHKYHNIFVIYAHTREFSKYIILITLQLTRYYWSNCLIYEKCRLCALNLYAKAFLSVFLGVSSA